MEHDERASQDAGAPAACAAGDAEILWLKPRGRKGLRRRRSRRRPRSPLTRLGVTLGVGAILTVTSAQSAVGPAVAQRPADLVRAGAIIDATAVAAREAEDATSAEPEQPFRVALSHEPAIDLQLGHLFEAVALDAEPAIEPQLGPLAEPPAVPDPVEELGARAGPRFDAMPYRVAMRGEEAAAPRANRVDEMLKFDGVKIPRSLVETILRAADATGVDGAYMMALADKESSFLVDNKASTSSAEGLFQFVEKTWLEVIREFGAKHGMAFAAASVEIVDGQPTIESEAIREWVLGLRRNPYLSALMAAEMLKRDKAKTERRIGRDLNRSELYLMHFLGAQSAGKLIELVSGKPKQSAPRVFPKAAKANKALFFAREKRKTRHLTVAEVYNKIDRMIDTRLDRYEGVTAFAPIETASFRSPL
jgi:hypothetical protein